MRGGGSGTGTTTAGTGTTGAAAAAGASAAIAEAAAAAEGAELAAGASPLLLLLPQGVSPRASPAAARELRNFCSACLVQQAGHTAVKPSGLLLASDGADAACCPARLLTASTAAAATAASAAAAALVLLQRIHGVQPHKDILGQVAVADAVAGVRAVGPLCRLAQRLKQLQLRHRGVLHSQQVPVQVLDVGQEDDGLASAVVDGLAQDVCAGLHVSFAHAGQPEGCELDGHEVGASVAGCKLSQHNVNEAAGEPGLVLYSVSKDCPPQHAVC
eukprot:8647-Heterococcus_DN1.PRE.2